MGAIKAAIGDAILTFMWVFLSSTTGAMLALIATALGLETLVWPSVLITTSIVFVWEARTRHRRCRTRVRRSGTRRCAGDSAARASGRVGPRGSHVVFTDARRREPTLLRRTPTQADSGRLGPESGGIGRIGRNSRFWPKLKKKKKPRTHRFTKH